MSLSEEREQASRCTCTYTRACRWEFHVHPFVRCLSREKDLSFFFSFFPSFLWSSSPYVEFPLATEGTRTEQEKKKGRRRGRERKTRKKEKISFFNFIRWRATKRRIGLLKRRRCLEARNSNQKETPWRERKERKRRRNLFFLRRVVNRKEVCAFFGRTSRSICLLTVKKEDRFLLLRRAFGCWRVSTSLLSSVF